MSEPEWVAALYDAAAGDGSWSDAMARLAEDLGASGVDCVLRAYDGEILADRSGRVLGVYSIPDELARDYAAHYERIDPMKPAAWAYPRGRVWRLRELVDPARLERSEWFNDWLLACGARDLMGTAQRFSGGALAVAIRRAPGHGLFDPADAPRAQRLLPHLTRAWDIAYRLRSAHDARDLAWTTLDAVPDAVIALRSDEKILYANEAAEELRRAGVIGRRLPGDGPLATRAPQRTVVRGKVYLWVYRPMPPRQARTGASALLFITEQSQSAAPNPSWLRVRFGLSSAEAQLVLGLLRGETLEDIAERRGVAMSTVRSQLKSAFNKTDTRRQAELVAAVLAAVPRLRPA